MMLNGHAVPGRLGTAAHAARPPRAELTLRLRFGADRPPLGPGKIALMEHILREGSISAASRAMGMSYHRATTIVNEINVMFRTPLIERKLGGRKGGGAAITPLGRDVVHRYRLIEQSIWEHAAEHIGAIESAIGQ
jgi:molybdate transport system regulatory protein